MEIKTWTSLWGLQYSCREINFYLVQTTVFQVFCAYNWAQCIPVIGTCWIPTVYMAFPCHGGAGCGLIILGDLDIHDPPEAVRPILQQHVAPEASTPPQWHHWSRKRQFTYELNTIPAPQHPQTCLNMEKETEAQSQKGHAQVPTAVHGVSGTRIQVSEYHSYNTLFSWVFRGRTFWTYSHRSMVPGTQVTNFGTGQRPCLPLSSDSSDTKCLQHLAGFSVFSF